MEFILPEDEDHFKYDQSSLPFIKRAEFIDLMHFAYGKDTFDLWSTTVTKRHLHLRNLLDGLILWTFDSCLFHDEGQRLMPIVCLCMKRSNVLLSSGYDIAKV